MGQEIGLLTQSGPVTGFCGQAETSYCLGYSGLQSWNLIFQGSHFFFLFTHITTQIGIEMGELETT